MTQEETDQSLTRIWEEAIKRRKAQELMASSHVTVPLPSGLEVKARRATIRDLVSLGRIPDGLTPFVIELMDLGESGEPDAADVIEEKIMARVEEWVRVLDQVWMICVVEPTFTRGAARPGIIPLEYVTIEDKMAFFNWCQGVTDYLISFRTEEKGAARAVDAGEGVSEVHGSGAPGDPVHSGDGVDIVADQHGGDDVGTVRRRPTRSPKREGSRKKEEPEASSPRSKIHVS